MLWEMSGGIPSVLLEMVFACVTALALATVRLHSSLIWSAALVVSACLCPQGLAEQLCGREVALLSYCDIVCAQTQRCHGAARVVLLLERTEWLQGGAGLGRAVTWYALPCGAEVRH